MEDLFLPIGTEVYLLDFDCFAKIESINVIDNTYTVLLPFIDEDTDEIYHDTIVVAKHNVITKDVYFSQFHSIKQ